MTLHHCIFADAMSFQPGCLLGYGTLLNIFISYSPFSYFTYRGAAAISAHYVSDLRDSDILTDGLRCPTDASEIESCEWLHSGGCQKNEVAGVVCHEDRGKIIHLSLLFIIT